MVLESLTKAQLILYLIALFLAVISMINSVTIFPIIFNRLIVPEIERKIGQKLGYYRITYKLASYSKIMGRYVEIAFYIFVKSIIHLFGKDPNKINVCPRTFALQKVNYPYEMFTKKEIIWSACAIINALLFIFCGGGLMLIVKYYGIH